MNESYLLQLGKITFSFKLFILDGPGITDILLLKLSWKLIFYLLPSSIMSGLNLQLNKKKKEDTYPIITGKLQWV